MRINLTWNPVSGTPTGYLVGVISGATETQIAAFPNTATEATFDLPLEPRVVHQFWVKAFDKAGNIGPKIYVLNAYWN